MYISDISHPDVDVADLFVREVDVGTEWRTFSNETNNKDSSRVGAAENPLLQGGDLSTMNAIDPTSAQQLDEFGTPMYRDRRTVNSADRALINAFREIRQMADRLNLPEMVSERKNTLFKQVNDTKSLKGRSNDAVCSACMYIACRQEGVPRTFKEICAVSKVSKKEIGRVFKLILKALETNVDLITTEDFMVSVAIVLYKSHHGEMGLTPYEACIGPDQPAQST
ncbi:hypothetical protein DPMN_151992 [Dreissena polymorpha]|uniref:Cyclin-like domain-containing protein n=1 Tax=Dreissena polymorpha TaxID=45954 RepID=A0A9D4J7I0_DREPO|nr:hypothetical protein DPMN_151992 [Dreissena polymorpha]